MARKLETYSETCEHVNEAVNADDPAALQEYIDTVIDTTIWNDALFLASKFSRMKCLSTLTSNKLGDLNYWNSTDDQTILGAACREGNLEAVKILISAGCDLNKRSGGYRHAPLHFATKSGAAECVQFLINEGAHIEVTDYFGNTPLILSVTEGKPDIVKILLLNGANPTHVNIRSNTAFSLAMQLSDSACVTELLRAYPDFSRERNKLGIYPLTDAIRRREPKLVKAFVDSGCELNCPESSLLTPVNLAVEIGDVDLIRTLAAGGADVSSPLPIPTSPTPLMVAVAKGNSKVVKSLIEVRCDIDAFDFLGRTALYLATKFGYVQCMMELLNGGASPDAYNVDKFEQLPAETPCPTSIHGAVMYDQEEEAVLLLQSGCDVDFPAYYANRSGMSLCTPMDVAVDRKLIWPVRLFLRYGSTCLAQAQTMITRDSVIAALYNERIDLLTAPNSLKRLCRTAVRHCLQNSCFRKIESLKLPKSISEFLLYKELEEL